MSDMRSQEQHAWYVAKEGKDYAEAARLFAPLAERCSETALLNLGWMHEHGRLGPIDLDKAISFYERAAQTGSARAKSYLGQALKDKGDLKRARAVFIEGAEQGDVRCMATAGAMLAHGQGGKANVEAGAAWLACAADSGDTFARRELSWLASQRAWDTLISFKFERAARLYEPLAARGSANALINLGVMYRNGWRGRPPDLEKAISYYEKAAATGYVGAKRYLGRALAAKGDLKRARILFIDGAKQDNTVCMVMAGKMLMRGLGGGADATAGRAWLVRAADRGQVSARRELLRLEMRDTSSPFRRLRLWGKRHWILLVALPRFLRDPFGEDFAATRVRSA
jgi:hypothetical protein